MRRTMILVGLAVTAGGVLLDRTDLAGPAPEATMDTWPVLSLLCLAAGGLGALAVRTVVGRTTALLGTAAGGAGVAVVRAVGTGEPGPSTGMLAVGGLAVVGGAALFAVAPVRQARSRVRVLLGSAGVVLLVVATATGGALAADWIPVRSQTAAAAEPVAPEPVLRPGAPRWRWTAPGRVDDLVPTAFGVSVRSGDTVSGVDGATGATRWTYRRAGADLDVLTESPDGRTSSPRTPSAGVPRRWAAIATCGHAWTSSWERRRTGRRSSCSGPSLRSTTSACRSGGDTRGSARVARAGQVRARPAAGGLGQCHARDGRGPGVAEALHACCRPVRVRRHTTAGEHQQVGRLHPEEAMTPKVLT